MGTVIRPEITKKNKYYISKERYYELCHFCRQYPEWKMFCNSLIGYSRSSYSEVKKNCISDPTFEIVQKREQYNKWIDMLHKAAKETDLVIGNYILKGVIDGVSYECLNARERIPCCKDSYYLLYRKFFWILSRLRDE